MQWHGNTHLTLIATTTHSPDRRELNFQKTENSFDDDDQRRMFLQLLEGTDGNTDESEDEIDTDDDIENIQEEVTDIYLSECLKRGKITKFGLILPSLQQNNFRITRRRCTEIQGVR